MNKNKYITYITRVINVIFNHEILLYFLCLIVKIKSLINISLFICLIVPNFGLTQAEKTLVVYTSSTAFENQTLNIDSITGGEITNLMLYSLPKRESWDSPLIKIIWNDSIKLAFETCRFNVWKWNNLEWENLYVNTNKGICVSDYFLIKNSLYGFTSQGFWSSQSGLYKFTNKSSNWDLINTKKYPKNFCSTNSFRISDDTIISLSGIQIEHGLKTIVPTSSSFGLNMKTLTWFEITENIKLKSIVAIISEAKGKMFDFKNDVIYCLDEFYIQINKKTKEVFFENSTDLSLTRSFDLIVNDTESATVLTDGKIQIIKPRPYKELTKIGSIIIRSNNVKKDKLIQKETTPFMNILIMVGSLLLIISIIVVKILSNNKTEQKLSHTKILSEFSGQILSSNEFDSAVGINLNLSQDSRRVQRSRIIKEINENHQKIKGKILITRIRDKMDNRYVLYKINEF